MRPVFSSVRSEIFALAKAGADLSHIEVSREEFEAVISRIEKETGTRHAGRPLEFLASGVLVRCVDSPMLHAPSRVGRTG